MMFKWLHVAPLTQKPSDALISLQHRRLTSPRLLNVVRAESKPPAAAVVDFHCLIFSFLTRARRCLIASSLNLHGEM